MTLTNRFEEALAYTCQVHATQRRKGTDIPYISHLLGVASIVLEHGGNEDEAIAGLLHDAVEDQGGQARLEDISARFGATVASIVAKCSDIDVVPSPPWRERKKAYIGHLETATRSVLLVSASDKLHNARAILRDYRQLDDNVWSRFNAGKDDQLWYYGALVAAFRKSGRHPELVAELERVVKEIHDLA